MVVEYKDEMISEKYWKKTLTSGFEIILVPKSGVYTKGAFLSVGYGGLMTHFIDQNGVEKRHPDGTAHFLEHKLFENEKIDLFKNMANYGANVNAFTSYVNTCYYFTGLEKFWECLDLLLQIPTQREYTREGIESEKNIIAREIDMHLDDDDHFSSLLAMQQLYPNHPIGRDIAGTEQSIQAIAKEVLDEVLDNFYVAKNMRLIVVGDFTKDHFQKIEECLPDFFKKESALPTVIYEEDGFEGELIESWIPKEMQPTMNYVIQLEPIGDKKLAFRRYVKYKILLVALFGESSEFYQNAYDRGLFTDFYSDYQYGQGYRYVQFTAETKKPRELARAIEEEIRRFSQHGIAQQDLQRIKNKLIGRFLMSYHSVQSVAMNHIFFDQMGVNVFEYMDFIREIDIDDFENLFIGRRAFSVVGRKDDESNSI